MIELIQRVFMAQSHFVLFAWSLICFGFGLLFAVILHYYWLHLVIRKADKILEEVRTYNRRSTDQSQLEEKS